MHPHLSSSFKHMACHAMGTHKCTAIARIFPRATDTSVHEPELQVTCLAVRHIGPWQPKGTSWVYFGHSMSSY